MSECEHGNLKRQCLICGLQDELHESRQECMRLSGMIGKLSGELASILDESKKSKIKATIEFGLPQCTEAHQTALDGWRWKLVATDFERYLHDLENADQNPPVEEIAFFVPGIPVAKGSAKAFVIRGTNRAVVTQTNRDKQKPWQSAIAYTAVENGVTAQNDGPVFVSMLFRMQRPKKHYRANGDLRDDAPQYHTNKPDVDKLARCVFDALTGVAWHDDCQAQICDARKVYCDQPGVDVVISQNICQGAIDLD